MLFFVKIKKYESKKHFPFSNNRKKRSVLSPIYNEFIKNFVVLSLTQILGATHNQVQIIPKETYLFFVFFYFIVHK